MANQRASAKFLTRLNSYVQLVASPKVSKASLELKNELEAYEKKSTI